jgi:integrase
MIFLKGEFHQMKLTQRAIAALALPEGKAEAVFFDDARPGFGVRLQGQSRRYIVQYKLGSKHRRMTLGSTTLLRLDDARDSAAKILARVRLGEDPAGEKQEARARATDVCEAVVRRYLTHQKARLRSKTYTATEHALLTHWKPLHALLLSKIERRTIASHLDEIAARSGPAAAGHARAVLAAFFSWAMRQGVADTNPVIGTNRYGNAKGRNRVLSATELVRVWCAAGEGAYGTIIKLLILTGQRREEIGGLRWSEVIFPACLIRLPPARVKNGRAHDVPLSEEALALLRGVPQRDGRDFVFGAGVNGFGGYGKPKRTLDERIAANGEPMPPWTIHDVRRTAATHMAEELGVQPHIIEATLNHVSGHKAGVAGIYNRALYEREKRTALDLWAKHVMGLVEGWKPGVDCSASHEAVARHDKNGATLNELSNLGHDSR